jgi:hypothetical protein
LPALSLLPNEPHPVKDSQDIVAYIWESTALSTTSTIHVLKPKYDSLLPSGPYRAQIVLAADDHEAVASGEAGAAWRPNGHTAFGVADGEGDDVLAVGERLAQVLACQAGRLVDAELREDAVSSRGSLTAPKVCRTSSLATESAKPAGSCCLWNSSESSTP